MLVIVPAYNESGSILDAIGEVAREYPSADVLVVDDGSSDGTGELARSAGATVLTLPCNLGVGGAVQTGYIYAAEHGYDAAVQYDADRQHRANLISSLVEDVFAGRADLTIGSRLLGGLRFRFHPLRFIGNRLLSMLVSLIAGQKITDPTSGFRAASKRAIRFFANHYPQSYLGDTAEALVWAARQKMRITEVPVRMRQRTEGMSAAGSLKGFWHMMRIVLAVLVDCFEPVVVEDQEPTK